MKTLFGTFNTGIDKWYQNEWQELNAHYDERCYCQDWDLEEVACSTYIPHNVEGKYTS